MNTVLQQHGALLVSRLVPVEFCHYLTHILLRQADNAPKSDEQVPRARAVIDHEYVFDTLQERLWPTIETIVSEDLLPTYSYARLYSNGDTLAIHTDRPACEISVTIQLGRSHHYAWPIFMGNQRFDMGEGDAIIYSGCDIEHWREPCTGPNNYYSGQVFLHFVRAKGKYAEEAGDTKVRVAPSYVRHRTFMMERK